MARGYPSHLTSESVTRNDPAALKGEIARQTATAHFMGLNTLARYIDLELALEVGAVRTSQNAVWAKFVKHVLYEVR